MRCVSRCNSTATTETNLLILSPATGKNLIKRKKIPSVDDERGQTRGPEEGE